MVQDTPVLVRVALVIRTFPRAENAQRKLPGSCGRFSITSCRVLKVASCDFRRSPSLSSKMRTIQPRITFHNHQQSWYFCNASRPALVHTCIIANNAHNKHKNIHDLKMTENKKCVMLTMNTTMLGPTIKSPIIPVWSMTDLAVVRWSSAGLTEVMVVQRPDL